MNPSAAIDQPIYSEFADDAIMRDLVVEFVAKLPVRRAELAVTADKQNWERLQTLAHQLKGAAGSYGFDAVTPVAADLEAACRDCQAGNSHAPTRQLDLLLDVLGRLAVS